jgi:integrase
MDTVMDSDGTQRETSRGAADPSTHWAGLRPATARAYARDLEHVAAALGQVDGPALLAWLCEAGPACALDAAARFVAGEVAAGRAPATIGRRLAALRSALSGCRLLGRIPWELPRLRQRLPRGRVRDVSGPLPGGLAALLEAAGLPGQPGRPSALRDVAALRLSWDLGLRRAELCGLQLDDHQADGARLRLHRKGGKVSFTTLPEPTRAALAAWLAARGPEAGPLLAACDQAGQVASPLRPLQAGQWWRRLRDLGAAVGVHGAHPHGLRHGAATSLLLAGVPVALVASFLGQEGLATVQEYYDRARDEGGAVAALAASLPGVAAAPGLRALPPGLPAGLPVSGFPTSPES